MANLIPQPWTFYGGLWHQKPEGGGGDIEVIGTITDGGTFSISGSGFGVMGGDVITFARGDEHTNLTAISGTSPTIGNPITVYGQEPTSEILYYSDEVTIGSRAAALTKSHFDNFNNGSTSKFGGFGHGNRNDPKLFISYFRYQNCTGYPIPTLNMKQYYCFSNGNPEAILHVPAAQEHWAMGTNAGVGGDPNITPYEDLIQTDDNVWAQWDNYLEMNTKGVSNGVAQVWRDGQLILESLSYQWQNDLAAGNATGWKDMRLGYYDTGMVGSNTEGAKMFYQDYYTATTKARVVIGDAPTFDACTVRVVQPVREINWSNTSLTSVLGNFGPWASVTGKWLYVILQDGKTPVNANGVVI